ncbi:MAG: polysaccharide deacetylase family protein [Candidatus Sumerlaeaceae bacterium]
MYRPALAFLCVALTANLNPAFSQYQPGQTYNQSGQQQSTRTPYPSVPAYTGVRPQQPYRIVPTSTPEPRKANTAKPRTEAPKKAKAEHKETVVKSAGQAQDTESKKPVRPEPNRTDSSPQRAASATASSTGSQVITAWPTGKKLVALTYDDGPDPFTPKLLDYLNENKVPATFYMLGERVKEYPGMVQTIVQTGHELGNHTYNHKQLTKMNAAAVREELSSTQDLLTSASNGAPVPTMRPPYGAHNSTVRSVCAELGYKVLLWDVDTNDWMGRPAAQMINTILKGTSDGSIILMHDRLHRGRDTVMETTRAIVPELRARGYTFVTVSQLLSNRRSMAVSSDAHTTATASAFATSGSSR